MKSNWLMVVVALMCGLCVMGYDESEWRVRPLEIIMGLQPHSALLWDCAKGDLGQWQVSEGGKLSLTDKTKLWGETVARLDLPPNGAVTLTPPAPIVIAEKVAGIDLWLFGPAGPAPTTTIVLEDAKRVRHKVTLSGTGSRWAKTRWWGCGAALLPEKAVFPLKVLSIQFNKLSNRVENDFLCFDRLGAYQVPKVEMVDSSKMKDVPFPTTPDGVMPIGMKAGASNSVAKEGDAFVFSYKGNDATVSYRYAPATGTFSDITATFNGKEFRPAVNGGIHAKVNEVDFKPSDSSIKATLEASSLAGDKVNTTWKWEKDSASFRFELNLFIKGKSLAVEVKSLTNGGFAFDCGKTEKTPKPHLFALTYLNNRWNYPRFLATDDYLMSVFLDWYFSNSSELLEGRGGHGIDGARIYDENSARVMGGSSYATLTDGSRNPIYEKMYITVSGELDDVMPNIANPPSRFLEETGKLVCCTRAYPLQGRKDDLDEEIAMWKRIHDYGATDIYVRYHTGLLRTPIESNDISFQLHGCRQNGNDEAPKRLVREVSQYVKRLGLYGDNRVVSPLNDPVYFNYGMLSQFGNGAYTPGWDGQFRPKPSVQLAQQRHYIPLLLAKFPQVNAQYMDETTNAPPWADVDFDAKAPGAGKFTTVLRDYGLVALQQKKMLNGPVWSEGCSAFFWAGLLDVDYAVSNDTKEGLPLIADFKLRKINPLENFTGADWPILRPQNADGNDTMIAQEILFGNIGHLGQSGEKNGMIWQGRAAVMKDYEHVLRSYFMIRQVQEYYSGQSPVSILYDIDGKMMTASQMLKSGKTSVGRVYAKYPNGLETWVNRSDNKWTVNADGEEFELPPSCGHVAIVPNKLLQYTALVNGHKVSYSRGKHFTYVNGNGELTEFPEMTAARAYLLRQMDGKTRLTPVPFIAAETIKGLDCENATLLNQDGSPFGEKLHLDITDAGKADLPVDGKAFHYQLD